jgi:hypothetical protein
MRIKNSIAILLLALIIISFSSCEEKVNDPSNTINIIGTWELAYYKQITPAGEKDVALGVEYPLTFRVFNQNNTFDQIEFDTNSSRYESYTYQLKDSNLTLTFNSGNNEVWKINRIGDSLYYERTINSGGQNITEKMLFRTSDKINFRNDVNFVGTWELASTVEIIGDQVNAFTPADSKVQESLNFKSDATFIETIDDNGSVTTGTGNWYNSYYPLVLKYSDSKVVVYSFSLDPDSGVLMLDRTYTNGQKVILQKEYHKK